jgi:hypothetical protein
VLGATVRAPREIAERASDPAVYENAGKDPQGFWASLARELDWQKPWVTVLEGRGPDARWFVGGKLNASVNCVDHLPPHAAIVGWVRSDEFSKCVQHHPL